MLTLFRSLKIYFLILFIFFIYRVSFATYFSSINFLQENFYQTAKAFFFGWRYDTIVICYLLAPFILLNILKPILLIDFFKKNLDRLLFLYIFLMTILVTLILVGDFGFFSFFQDHLNILAFGLFEDDTQAVIESVQKNYPFKTGLALIAIFSITLYFSFKKIFKSKLKMRFQFKTKIISYLCFLILFAGGVRGGYGMMVLSPKYADFSKHQIINEISLNGIITFERAYKLRKSRASLDFNMATAMGYGKNIHKAFSDYLGIDVSSTRKDQLISLIERKTPENKLIEDLKPNVVVFVMESFGAHWIKYNNERFNFLGDLDKHFKEDILFENILSGDNGTIGSLMVLGTNIPNRSGARFISESRYMRLPLISAAQLPYTKRGYETSFLYGGKLSWRDIGKYFSSQGFHKIEGESHIREELNLNGKQGTEWGLYDEHLFNFIYKKLNSGTTSKFIMALSTTNHPPFEVPKNFKSKSIQIPKELEGRISREKSIFLERFLAFQYSNQKLAEFIQKVKNSKLAQNTIIAVTGDHNFWGFMNYSSAEAFSKYKVPFYIYLPESLKPKSYDNKMIGGHEDIMTTLYNLSLSNTKFYAFGDDLLTSKTSNALNSSVYASKFGGFYKGKSFSFVEDNSVFNSSTPKELDTLQKQYRSTLSIADFLLRNSYKQNSKNSQN